MDHIKKKKKLKKSKVSEEWTQNSNGERESVTVYG